MKKKRQPSVAKKQTRRGSPQVVNIDGSELAKVRVELGKPQEDLAKRIGCSLESIGNWERNVHPPRLSSASALTVVLKGFGASEEQLRRIGLLPPDAPAHMESIPGAIEGVGSISQQTLQTANRTTLESEIFSAADSIARHGEEFVGREFVYRAVDEFFANQSNSSGYFIAIGEPGIGKSAFARNFVKRTGCIAHFNCQSTGINQTSQFLRSVSAQLILKYDLPFSELPKDVDQNGSFLARLLNEASSRLKSDKRLVIAVDALDEIDLRSQSTRANILYLPPSVPPGVFFLMTSRERESIGVFDSPVQQFRFRDHSTDCKKDAATYIQSVAESRLGGWLQKHKRSISSFTDKLVDKSGGNFMYLKHILSDIAAGRYDDRNLNHLPRGLEAYYADHWKRMGMNADPLPEDKIHVIYLLARAPSAWPLRRIAIAAGLKPLRVQGILDEWREFLRIDTHDHEDCYSIYHTSFTDFLLRHDIVKAAGQSFDQIDDDLLRPLLDDFRVDEESHRANFDSATGRATPPR